MLLALPPELRAQIYDHLLPPNPLAHPVPSIALTSVSHHPLPIPLLLICHILTDELLAHYYRHATFKLVLSHAFNFYRIDPALDNLNNHPILQRIENVELVFFCDGVLVRDYPSFGPERACLEVERRAERAVEVLQNAVTLKRVTVSWVDPGGHWGTRSTIVRPVQPLLERRVIVEVGEVLGVEDVLERNNLICALKTELTYDTARGSEAQEETHRVPKHQPRDSVVEGFIDLPWIKAHSEQHNPLSSEPGTTATTFPPFYAGS